MKKLRALNKKLWKFTNIFCFLGYGVICLTEGLKVYTGYAQDEQIPTWSVYLFLSVAVLIPGLLSFATKNKDAIARFFIGSARLLISAALLIGCFLSQKGLEREKVWASSNLKLHHEPCKAPSP